MQNIMESQSLPRRTGRVGGTGNLMLRPERDCLSEIHLETDTVARGAFLGIRMCLVPWYNVGALRGLASFNLLLNYI